MGDAPIDGKTDTNPEGLTAAVGKHAEAFAARLATADLSCKVLLAWYIAVRLERAEQR